MHPRHKTVVLDLKVAHFDELPQLVGQVSAKVVEAFWPLAKCVERGRGGGAVRNDVFQRTLPGAHDPTYSRISILDTRTNPAAFSSPALLAGGVHVIPSHWHLSRSPSHPAPSFHSGPPVA